MDSKQFWTAVAVLAFWELIGRRLVARHLTREKT